MNINASGIITALAALLVTLTLATDAAAQCCETSQKSEVKTDKKDCAIEINDTEAKPEVVPEAKPGEAEIKVPTLQCGMCIKNISKAIKAVEGVTDVTVDRKNKLAKVSFDPEKTSLEKIEAAIVKAGYAANDKKADGEAYSKLPDCCKVE